MLNFIKKNSVNHLVEANDTAMQAIVEEEIITHRKQKANYK